MKSVNRICLMMILCCVCCINIAQAAVNPKPFVIPELKEWKGNEGKFIPTEQTRIVYPKGNSELQRIARMLADDCNTLFNHTPQIVEGKGKKGDLILSLKKDKSLGQEGYAIRVTDRIELTAPKAIGVYWGTRTLLQIAEQNKEDLALPKGEIRDYPDYAMRGFMIDCGRKFIPMSYLRDYVKIMAYYKMNTLQIHLNDNGFKQYFEQDWNKTYAAFRLESDTYPGLTARDGFYTKKEFKDFIKDSRDYGVSIVPEIDTPAHSLALTKVRPDLRHGTNGRENDHLALRDKYDESLGFVQSIFDEFYSFCAQYYSTYILGEVPVKEFIAKHPTEKDLGLLSTYGYGFNGYTYIVNFKAKNYDLEDYTNALFDKPEEDFMNENANYPIVIKNIGS